MRAFLQAYTEAVVNQTLVSLGMTAGEISQRQAKKVYGKWFEDCVNTGRIRPVRQEAGHAGTIYYSLSDILAAKAEDRLPATLINK